MTMAAKGAFEFCFDESIITCEESLLLATSHPDTNVATELSP